MKLETCRLVPETVGMLREMVQYWTSSCPPYARKMGFLSESIGIQSRYRRCKGAWESHLEQSKAFILQGVKRCKARERVMVLGCGSLLDVPLEALSCEFNEVWLVDLIQSPEVEKALKQHLNTRWVQCDVTGLNQGLFQGFSLGHDPQKLLEALTGVLSGPLSKAEAGTPILSTPSSLIFETQQALSDRLELNRCDYLISANLLSQLGYVATEFIRKHSSLQDPPKFERFRIDFIRRLARDHLQLCRLASCVCLITDFESRTLNRAGKRLDAQKLIPELGLPKPHCEWDWLLAPEGEIRKDQSTIRRVAAYYL